MKILVCEPSFYDVTYSINPWMSPENGVDANLAIKQWHDLVTLLEKIGAEVVRMPGQPNLPDLVFTANAGLRMNEEIILLSNFKFPERQPEKEFYRQWFENNNYICKDLPDHIFFEGAGDALLSSDEEVMFMGYGFRSDIEVPERIKWDINVTFIVQLKLIDPYFYHLDTCFCPLSGGGIMYYPAAFGEQRLGVDSYTIQNYLKQFKVIDEEGPILLEIPENEAKRFACNAVNVGNNVIIPSGCPETAKMLTGAGYNVYDTDMSEYIKAGGACKCLTFKLDENN